MADEKDPLLDNAKNAVDVLRHSGGTGLALGKLYLLQNYLEIAINELEAEEDDDTWDEDDEEEFDEDYDDEDEDE